MNPNSINNLKPFKKGEDSPNRNKKGRPKIPSLKKIIAEVLGDEAEVNGEKISAAKAVLVAQLKKAIRGDVKAAEFLFNRGYGKPVESIDHTTKGDKLPAAPVYPAFQIVIERDNGTDEPAKPAENETNE